MIPDPAYQLNLDPKTSAALTEFSRRRRLLLIMRAIAAGTIILIVSMLVIALCDYLFFLSDSVRWLMSLVGYVSVVAAMWHQGLRHVSENDPKNLARKLESAAPKLREDLLSAVELADPNLVNGSEGFRQRLQRNVARRVSGIEIRRLLPFAMVSRWLVVGGIALTFCAVLTLVPRMQFGRRIARAMLPGLAIERASLTEVTILKPSPPTGFVAEGDAVGVVVKIAGLPADRVMLRFRSEEGGDGETEMTARVQPNDVGGDGTLEPVQTYAANLAVGSESLQYQVVAGDAITLWHTLTPLPRPRVQSFEKRYEFPKYARLNDRVETAEHGDLKALLGTMAYVTVLFDEPVENAFVRFANHGIEVPLEAVDSSKQKFVTSIPIKTPGQYQMDATSARSGLNNPFSPQYTIDPVFDSAPICQWVPTQQTSSLASPLDVLSLAATISDDLPLDRVIQEYMVNSEPMRERDVGRQESSREISLRWDWDLMRRENVDAIDQEEKLTAGDIVRTRVVAIDRRGNRGESRWIEFLITDEGFDADRHARLDRISVLSIGMSQWAIEVRDVYKQIATIHGEDSTADYDAIAEAARELNERKQNLITQLKTLLGSSRDLPEASTFELAGRTMIDLDQKLGDAVARWSEVRDVEHPSWKKSREKAIRDIANFAKRYSAEASRLEQLARSHFGQQFTLALVGDGDALRGSLAPLLDEENELPAVRFPRHLTVVVGRLEAINQLIRQNEAALPETTVRHYEAWFRWSDSWSSRLRTAIQEPKSEAEYRQLAKQFDSELVGQVSQALVDGQIPGALNNMLREIQNQLGPVADKLRAVTSAGESMTRASAAVEKEESSEKVSAANHDLKLARGNWDRALAFVRGRLQEEEDLHRSRPVVDLQYAADMKLLGRAIENVTQEGYVPYREEPAAQVHQKLANAFQLIEAKHHADLWRDELGGLLDAERRLESTAEAKIMHPWWLERYSAGMEWPVRWLRNLAIPWPEIEPIEMSRYNVDYTQARNRITSRRWTKEELLTADAPLTSLEQEVAVALANLQPRVDDARATIQKYVLTLSEQAREAAEKVEEAKDRTQSREDSEQATAEDLSAQQQEAELAAAETIESLVDLANTSDLADREQRELARDADAAATQIQDALDQAKEQMSQAVATESDGDRAEQLNETAETLEDLANALERTAEHFENAENGNDLTESREELRQAEAELEIEDSLQQRYDEAEAMAESAQQDAQQLLEKLEEELQTNEPMREELSEIAERATEAAQRTLQQAARDETSLNQSLERSDPVFQEKKRRVAKKLETLARRATSVDQSLLNATEKAIGWAKQPDTLPKLEKARQQLRDAVNDVNSLGGENALLSDMQEVAEKMADAIDEADDVIDDVQQTTNKAADEEIHEKESSKSQAKQQVERYERDARTQQLQAANNEKRNWTTVERDASRRMQNAQRQKRDAEKSKRSFEDRLKKDPKNEASLRQQADVQQARIDQAARTEEVARETRDLADREAKETDKRIRAIQQQKNPPLKKPNPAAEVASRMAERANNELEAIRGELNELSEQSGFEDDLRVPQAQVEQMTNQQQRIQDDVADAAAQLERAARHEERLGQQELAQQLAQAAEMISDGALQATEQATEALQNAAEDSGNTPEASEDVGNATDKIADAAQQLAQMLAAGQPSPSEPSAAEPSQSTAAESEEQAQGQQLARTLDELDRSLAQSPPSAEGSEQPSDGSPQEGQAENGQPQDGQPQDGQGQDGQPQPGQPGQQSAAEASSTLANAMNAQAQEAARQRQQQMNPQQGQGDQPGESSQQAADTQPGARSGSGDMPDGGVVDTSGIDRLGSEWGQLRERRTENATESEATQVAPQYRREIEAYFRAVARRAAEKSK